MKVSITTIYYAAVLLAALCALSVCHYVRLSEHMPVIQKQKSV